MERFIAVQYPLQRPTVCTVHRAKCMIAVLIAVALLLHIYIAFAAGVHKVIEVNMCFFLFIYLFF